MRLIYHPAAEAELIEGAKFYAARASGLGLRFLEAVEAAIQSIKASPTSWQVERDDIRRRRVRQFPYSILYRIVDDELRILTIKHHS